MHLTLKAGPGTPTNKKRLGVAKSEPGTPATRNDSESPVGLAGRLSAGSRGDGRLAPQRRGVSRAALLGGIAAALCWEAQGSAGKPGPAHSRYKTGHSSRLQPHSYSCGTRQGTPQAAEAPWGVRRHDTRQRHTWREACTTRDSATHGLVGGAVREHEMVAVLSSRCCHHGAVRERAGHEAAPPPANTPSSRPLQDKKRQGYEPVPLTRGRPGLAAGLRQGTSLARARATLPLEWYVPPRCPGAHGAAGVRACVRACACRRTLTRSSRSIRKSPQRMPAVACIVHRGSARGSV